jgi:hypothetical protein
VKKYNLKMEFITPLLGTAPMDPEIFRKFIASRNPDGVDETEMETIEESLQKGATGFRKVNGAPLLMAYQIKGFFKDVAYMLRQADDSPLSAKLKNYRKVIDGLVFAFPDRIFLNLPSELTVAELYDGQPGTGNLERPLRAQTPQGERVCLACSEIAPIGTTIEMQLLVLADSKTPEALLREWLEYGILRGCGQWRNGGYGRFTYTLAALA